MNNNETIHVDDHCFEDFVKSMDQKALNKAEKAALRKTIGIIKSQTSRNLRSRWSGAYSTRHGRKVAEGLIANVQKSSRGGYYGQVHIMGNQKHDSRGYMLRFFEMGTVERFRGIRSRAYRGSTMAEIGSTHPSTGRIKGYWFFRDAVAQKKDETFRSIDDNMQEAVAKQWVKSASK